jgi:hypothetical protein
MADLRRNSYFWGELLADFGTLLPILIDWERSLTYLGEFDLFMIVLIRRRLTEVFRLAGEADLGKRALTMDRFGDVPCYSLLI